MTIAWEGPPRRKILLENYFHCDTMPAMRQAAIAVFKAHA
jgi:hypothetical protein